MVAKFYAGGFLYNPKAKKILLHKRDSKTINNPNSWAFFGGLRIKGETPLATFKREVEEELGIKLLTKSIKRLTDYFNSDFDTHRYVFYALVEETDDFVLGEGEGYGWFTIKKVMSLKLTKRTKQDLSLFQKKLL